MSLNKQDINIIKDIVNEALAFQTQLLRGESKAAEANLQKELIHQIDTLSKKMDEKFHIVDKKLDVLEKRFDSVDKTLGELIEITTNDNLEMYSNHEERIQKLEASIS